jgi:WD40 repeat protein
MASLQPAGQPQTDSGCRGCDVLLWDVDAHVQIAALPGHTSKPDGLAFSPDGQTLASSADDQTILWSVPQRARMSALDGGWGPLAFSSDGEWLASGADPDFKLGRLTGTTLWDVGPGLWSRRLCSLVGRDLTPTEWGLYVSGRGYEPVC